jgi:hypothetical protein
MLQQGYLVEVRLPVNMHHFRRDHPENGLIGRPLSLAFVHIVDSSSILWLRKYETRHQCPPIAMMIGITRDTYHAEEQTTVDYQSLAVDILIASEHKDGLSHIFIITWSVARYLLLFKPLVHAHV